MSIHGNGVPGAGPDHFEDEFGSYLECAKQNPVFRAAYEDAEERHGIIDKLVKLRRRMGLSQKTVALRMQVRQPTVSGFETEGSDPRLSTLQRYARAVGARIKLVVIITAETDWISTSTLAYRGTRSTQAKVVSIRKGDLASAWEASSSGDDWVASA
ncbi:helix-turn-helix domain-containing protein [Microbispora rosea]|uniref:helix-turn-helix domain-containing protein n=1 Tax=Microbispora rosea TaxID=58117 RepID=UPI003799064D